MIWHELDFHPRDLLFFRDARPMAGGSAGRGDNWPLPQTLHGALLAGLHASFPETQPWETLPSWSRGRGRTDPARFGQLRAVGPFPVLGDQMYVPTPRDLVATKNGFGVGYEPLRLPAGCASNLPDGLLPIARRVAPSKESIPSWISCAELCNHLQEKTCTLTHASDLYDSEASIGIGMDPATGTVEESKLYSAHKLRLREGVSLRMFAALPTDATSGSSTDPLAEWLNRKPHLLLGGENATVRVESRRNTSQPFSDPVPNGTRVKWTLLTPAIYTHGWKPGWIDETLNVRLPAERPGRTSGETRSQWRKRIQEQGGEIKAKLVSALVPAPRHASGWSLGNEGPKPTQRYVEAGSVYYFEADTPADAAALRRALHGKARSDHLAEKGCGLGLCSSWNYFPEIPV